MFTRSIRWRFTLWLAFLLVALLSGFGVTAHHLARTERMRLIDEELQTLSMRLAIAVPRSTSPEATRPRENVAGFPRGSTQYFTVWLSDGGVQARSGSAPAGLTRPPVPVTEKRHGVRMRGTAREYYRFIPNGRCFLIGRPIDADLAALRRQAWLLVAAGGGVLALGLGGGWWLASRALRPVEEISAAATRIAAGKLAERIAVAETDSELGRLATVLNATFARLEAAFARQRQFTADASHELRTPLAVLISEAQTTLTRERSAPEYRETVEVCLETAQQMRRLTESLLDLARFDDATEPGAREPVDLATIAETCAGLIRPLAASRRVSIACELTPAATLGDATRLEQVVTNLLANALHYSPDGGTVTLRTSADNGAAILSVTDTGAGIAPEDLPHIFERFYRADKSRARSEGRAGLGLAICRAICGAHGGRIEVQSELRRGSTFMVKLPSV
jgi:two-component system, OmpR family, sensor kinase